ncbi:Hypothetical protein IALB_1846 [Ignavibacterium album JCM 16511]|uniref:DUF2851 domain-containing protein n=1 Tax=Ignavibacterium album (strain DSM 19864 / JCM 16511 / NBRC 101810 / Mat9-16) TaxID=945713 RepID=I0AKP5_IGNAJ|nr:DUF2851 family protein [Ignavibacterium album]AFH49552.1 Hypothetical protein IALB_1846 [Ignavibacterium album JCM 16511]
MKKYSRVPEQLIYKIWEEKQFTEVLKTSDGTEIEVIDPGSRNNDKAGPDFHNARIRIGNITFTGDVEIDTFHSDWRSHGHHLNQRYNKTILHITIADNQSSGYVTTQSGRHVPTLNLSKYLSQPLRQTILTEISKIGEDEIKMPCSEVADEAPIELKLKFIKELGLLRYRKKCDRFLARLKELIVLHEVMISEPKINHDFHKEIEERTFSSSDFENAEIWQQLLYEEIFEALGYSKNKDAMMKLSHAVDINFFRKMPKENFVAQAESALFFISGLVPEPNRLEDEETSEYIRNLYENWEQIKSGYDGVYFNKSHWHFFKLRPQNFPTVRIAAGARLLDRILNKNLFSRIIGAVSSIENNYKLISKLRDLLIVKGEGYWSKHFNFNKGVRTDIKYFIGLGRADETIVNIILPILTVYFEIFNKRKIAERILALYIYFSQKESNHLVDEVSEVLDITDKKLRSVYYQGMIELFRNYCIKQQCLECEIGKKVFAS